MGLFNHKDKSANQYNHPLADTTTQSAGTATGAGTGVAGAGASNGPLGSTHHHDPSNPSSGVSSNLNTQQGQYGSQTNHQGPTGAGIALENTPQQSHLQHSSGLNPNTHQAGYGGNAPVTGHSSTNQTSSHGHGVSSSLGQHAGHDLNSQHLLSQAEAKQREAAALQKQSMEVAEAERLEREAIQARERAVNHGAHPMHSVPH